MTNGNYIRSLTDEEMAEKYANDYFDSCCRGKDRCYRFLQFPGEECKKCFLEWLKAEVGE